MLTVSLHSPPGLILLYTVLLSLHLLWYTGLCFGSSFRLQAGVLHTDAVVRTLLLGTLLLLNSSL